MATTYTNLKSALGDKRAAAGGGIVVNAGGMAAAPVAASPAADDPTEKLKKLKMMLDNELLTPAEYNERRIVILASF